MYTVHEVVLRIESYVAQPYWPEAHDVINIQKKSGMNFARTDAKRDETLKSYLDKIGMTPAEYKALEAKKDRPWYRLNPDDPSTEIVIPRHQFSGMLVETCNRSPSSVIKTALADNLRTLIRITDFGTGRTKQDEYFERYIQNDKTNMRRFQRDEVIKNFDARGLVTFDTDVLKLKTVESLLKYAMTNIGVGGCRKMGFGRGKLLEIKATERTVESPIDAPTELADAFADLAQAVRKTGGGD